MAVSTKTSAKKTSATAKAPGKKPAAAKAPAKKAAAKPAAPSKKAAAPAKPIGQRSSRKPAVSDEQRRHYVEVAAYFIAERHGFQPGRELADWAEAEAEIERLLLEGLLNP